MFSRRKWFRRIGGREREAGWRDEKWVMWGRWRGEGGAG